MTSFEKDHEKTVERKLAVIRRWLRRRKDAPRWATGSPAQEGQYWVRTGVLGRRVEVAFYEDTSMRWYLQGDEEPHFEAGPNLWIKSYWTEPLQPPEKP